MTRKDKVLSVVSRLRGAMMKKRFLFLGLRSARVGGNPSAATRLSLPLTSPPCPRSVSLPVLFGTLLALSLWDFGGAAWGQGSPVLGEAVVRLEAPAEVDGGVEFEVLLKADLTGATGVDSTGGQVPAELAAVVATLYFHRSSLRLLSVAGPVSGRWTAQPSATATREANSLGRVVVAAAQRSHGTPSAELLVATLRFVGRRRGEVTLGFESAEGFQGSSLATAYLGSAGTGPVAIPVRTEAAKLLVRTSVPGPGPWLVTLLFLALAFLAMASMPLRGPGRRRRAASGSQAGGRCPSENPRSPSQEGAL